MLDRIKKIVNDNPHLIAYEVNNDSITYQELWNKALKYSALLIRQGNKPVIIYDDKSINYLITILACLISKRAYVPLNKQTPYNRILKIMEMTNASLIITDSDLMMDNINICQLTDLDQYQDNDNCVNHNNIAYIIFTSGSTGVPKGVPITYDNLDNFINWIGSISPLKQYEHLKVLEQAHFSFDLSVADLYYALCYGHTLVSIDNNMDYLTVYNNVQKVNVAFITPTFIRLLLVDKTFNEDNFPYLKCLYFCGEMLQVHTVKKLFERFPNIQIINAYGPTEATSAVSAINITKDMLNDKLLPVGDIEKSATKIIIEDNKIVLKGKSVFKGYLGNIIGGYYQEDSIDCFNTGDIGYIEDNKLYCKGRSDSQIKYKGYRIELNEIEYYISAIDGVNNCCVIAKYDNNNTVTMIKAFVEISKDINIKEELKKDLPSYMIPKVIKVMDKIPINNNGKIDRKALSNL